jgi:hypothetical protein
MKKLAVKREHVLEMLSYTEHLRVWNGFKEYCDDKDPRMNDYYKSCKPKKYSI